MPKVDIDGRSTNIRDGGDRDLLDHISALRRYASALVGNHADADDLVQEALKRALVYFDGDREIENLRAYLFTILHRVRIDLLKQKSRMGVQIPVEDLALVAVSASQGDRFACRQAVEAIRHLSEEHREVLLLVGVEGMSYREAAEVLDLKIGTVMSRLSRARATLRQMMNIEGELEFDNPS
ncbi:MAG TPA: sigma-70 family RNA polymerase sigma factor [Thermohalobaculum sp.]|nr:sigma-70 family RNA polymerase sigma factor [Thermohalobaculum sp.]